MSKTVKRRWSAALLAVLLFISAFFTYGPKYDDRIPSWDKIYSIFRLSDSSDEIYNCPFTVTYIDVGQGDASLIHTEDCSILIDAGSAGNEERIRAVMNAAGAAKLDYVIATHPHEDHIGSMAAVIQNAETENLIIAQPDMSLLDDESLYKNFLSAAYTCGANVISARPGTEYVCGSVHIQIMAPVSERADDLNDFSVVVRITYGTTSFIFMGDAQEAEESTLLSYGNALHADVLKAGHHGSSSSSTEAFVKCVMPKAAVISCGRNNDYGHPHAQTLKTFQKNGIEIFRTDEQGNIVIGSDGKSVVMPKNQLQT